MTIRILFYSLRETESQSVSPRVQPTSSLAQWVSFPVMCLSKPWGRVHPGTQLWLLCAGGGQANAPKLMPIPMPTPWDREPSKLKSMLSVSIKSLSRMESTSQSRLLGTFSISRLAAILL